MELAAYYEPIVEALAEAGSVLVEIGDICNESAFMRFNAACLMYTEYLLSTISARGSSTSMAMTFQSVVSSWGMISSMIYTVRVALLASIMARAPRILACFTSPVFPGGKELMSKMSTGSLSPGKPVKLWTCVESSQV